MNNFCQIIVKSAPTGGIAYYNYSLILFINDIVKHLEYFVEVFCKIIFILVILKNYSSGC